MSHSPSSSVSSIDIPVCHLDLSNLYDFPTESDEDFFTKPIVPSSHISTPTSVPLAIPNAKEEIEFGSIDTSDVECLPPDDFDNFMDSLPDFPIPPTTIPSNPIPLEDEFQEWLYAPPYLPTRRLSPHQPKVSSPLSPNSPPHRRNRFNRSSTNSSISTGQHRRKRKGFPVFRLEVLLKETKKSMDAKKAEGVNVTEWEKFFERVKNQKKEWQES